MSRGASGGGPLGLLVDGPLFHSGTVVAINTWTFSWRCDGPNLEYRIDSPIAQTFLNANL